MENDTKLVATSFTSWRLYPPSVCPTIRPKKIENNFPPCTSMLLKVLVKRMQVKKANVMDSYRFVTYAVIHLKFTMLLKAYNWQKLKVDFLGK